MLSMASKWRPTIMVRFACGETAIQKLQMVAQGQREMQCNHVSTEKEEEKRKEEE